MNVTSPTISVTSAKLTRPAAIGAATVGAKFTSVASVPELFTRQQQIATATFEVIELAIVASMWYLAMTSILTVGQYYLERHFGRGTQRGLPPTPLERFRRMLVTFHAPPPIPPETPVSLPSEHR